MRYVFDHDLHIHSWISLCSGDPEQSPETILQYAKDNHLKKICLTDHYWDETIPGASDWYKKQNTAWIEQAKPLPTADGISFLFGAETDMCADGTIGVNAESAKRLDFIIVPTTHLHMNGFTCRGDEDAAERAEIFIKRFETLLAADLPFEKVGLAHLTCSLMYPKHNHKDVLDRISDAEFRRLFYKAAVLGLGIELNFPAIHKNGTTMTWTEDASLLRPYALAKECGCKFYFGSDAHHPQGLMAEKQNAETIIDLLSLEESDKFAFAKA